MSDPEDRTEPGRARRHARPPAEDDAPPPPQGGWPSRYGPRPDLTLPPDLPPHRRPAPLLPRPRGHAPGPGHRAAGGGAAARARGAARPPVRPRLGRRPLPG